MSGLRQLAHYAVRAPDLAASRRFYVEVLGLREGYRPPFRFPGAWLYLADDESDFGAVHLIGEGEDRDAYLGARAAAGAAGSGCVDHIAFLASGWSDMRARCERRGARYEERRVPDLGLRQVFLTDPAGVVIELNYPAQEPDI